MPRLIELSSSRKVLLGVVHLRPLPGSPRHEDDIRTLVSAARADAEAILAAGFDGYVLENFGDAPFHPERVPPHVLTVMTRIACDLPKDDAVVIVNVLRNDAAGALAIAAAAELHGIRVNVHSGAMVTDQGIIEGRAAETLRLRRALAPGVAILADVDVKHAAPLAAERYTLAEAARDIAYRGLADALVVTGKATGGEASLEDLHAVRQAVPDRPVLVGSGVTVKSAARWLDDGEGGGGASGLIVGSAIERGGKAGSPVDPARARRFVQAARA